MAGRYAVAAVAVVAGVLAVVAQEPATGPAVPQYQRMLKGEDARRAAAMEKQMQGLFVDGKVSEARQIAAQLLALRVKRQGRDHWQVRDAELDVMDLSRPWSAEQLKLFSERDDLNDRVIEYSGQGKALDAQKLAEKSLTIARELFGRNHPYTALSLNNLADLQHTQAKWAEAELLYKQALSVFRTAAGNTHPHTAATLNNLATLYHDQGKLIEAEELYREALEIRRNTFGNAHLSTSMSLNNLAELYREQGKWVDAEPLYRESLGQASKVLGKVHPSTATCQNNLGLMYHSQGKLADAEPLYLVSLDSRRKTLGETHPDTAYSLNNIAELYRDQGKFVDAELWHREALRVLQVAHGDAHPDIITSLNNLAVVFSDQGKLAEAEQILRDALAFRRKALGATHPDTIMSLNNIAEVYRAQGKWTVAEPLHREALESSRKTLGSNHPSTATSLNNMAALYSDQGRLNEAEPLFREALAVIGKSHGVSHHTAVTLSSLGVLRRKQGRLADAESLLRDAAAAAERARLTSTKGIDRAVSGSTRPFMLLAATFAARQNLTAAATTLETGLARGLLDELAARRPDVISSDEAARQAKLVADIVNNQPRVLFLTTQIQRTDSERRELETLITNRLQLEIQLSELAVTVSRRELAEQAAISDALPADGAWVAWLDLEDRNLIVESWACVVRPVGEPRWVRLNGTGEKDAFTPDDSALPQRVRTALGGDAEKKVRPAPAAEAADLAKKLRDQRIAPILPHLAGVKTLYVTATGPMAGVPIGLLAPEFTVSYTPSGTFLARLPSRPRPAGDAVLAVGDPVFTRPGAAPAPKALPPGGLLVTTVAPGGTAAKANIAPGDVLLKYADIDLPDIPALQKAIDAHAGRKSVPVVVWREGQPGTATRDVAPGKLGVVLAPDPAPVAIANRRRLDVLVAGRGGDWKDLPGTRVELARLRGLFGDKATVLADSAASEHGLNDLRKAGGLKRFRFVHLATHGEGNTVRAMESSLILAQDKLPGNLLAKEGEPLLDGRLTAREVLDHWQLDAELVTLSACETAIGVKAGGDGLLGFAQAFLVAGSRSVCLSLWKVDDTATALLMDRFYRNLLGRRAGLAGPMGKASALAEAQTWLRDLSADQVLAETATLTNGVVRGPGQPALRLEPPAAGGGGVRPFAHPRYWAAFILIGDPN